MAVGLKKLVGLSKLREVRLSHGLSQGELHERSGVAVSTIHALETGERGAHKSTAEKLARALETPLAALTGKAREDSVDSIGSGNRIPRSSSAGRGVIGFLLARDVAQEAAVAEAQRESAATGQPVEQVLADCERVYERVYASVLVRSEMSLQEQLERVRSHAHEPIGGPGALRYRSGNDVSGQLRKDRHARDY